jgi:hypothetical protein
MDLKLYYQRIRDAQAKIEEAYAIVVSHQTEDGGKEGRMTEVSPALAAKMMVEGTARLALPEEAAAFREACAEAKRAVDEAATASKMQVTLVPTADLNRLRGGSGEPGGQV